LERNKISDKGSESLLLDLLHKKNTFLCSRILCLKLTIFPIPRSLFHKSFCRNLRGIFPMQTHLSPEQNRAFQRSNNLGGGHSLVPIHRFRARARDEVSGSLHRNWVHFYHIDCEHGHCHLDWWQEVLPLLS
jgi:hypothetical protein